MKKFTLIFGYIKSAVGNAVGQFKKELPICNERQEEIAVSLVLGTGRFGQSEIFACACY